ncbi:hypothetical protein FACS1894125_3230 [Actinomycetota bacterium]|nr:hypothetical protein FACS1894125_3230 [Actinomycetota bacterium]
MDVLIFSGYNERAVIAFLRSLLCFGITPKIVARDEDDAIFLTTYAKYVIYTRKNKQLEMSEIAPLIERPTIIAPSTEFLNRWLLENRSELEQIGATIPLVNKDLYAQISDKYSFGELCKNYEIRVPSEYSNFTQAKQHKQFVAKPFTYFSEDKKVFAPQIVLDAQDLSKFEENFRPEDFYYQEYLTGRSLYLLYYFDKNGNVYKFSQENLLQQPEGKSMLAAVSTNIHELPVSKRIEELFKGVNYRGLVMVELSQVSNTGSVDDFVMIEANPRFWGPSQLFVDADVNLFANFLSDWGMLSSNSSTPSSKKGITKYFYGDGFPKDGDNIKVHQGFYDYYSNLKEFNDDLESWKIIDLYNKKDTNDFNKRSET